MSKNPKNESSAKQQAIAERAELAYQLIESGVPQAMAVNILQSRLKIGRSSAYNAVQSAQIQYEDHQRHDSDLTPDTSINQQEVAALLKLQLQQAFADGDTKGMVQLVKELDRIRQWSAPCQSTSEPLQQLPGFGTSHNR